MAATSVGAKPLHAWIGASDLAVEKVKTLPSEVAKLPTQAKAKADQLTGTASTLYRNLVARGEQVLARRNSKATTDELEQAASA